VPSQSELFQPNAVGSKSDSEFHPEIQKEEFTRKDSLEEASYYGENPLMGDEGGAGISAGGSTNASAGRYHDNSLHRIGIR
jgi:hypothetical protein